MKKFAIIENNVVTNLITAEDYIIAKELLGESVELVEETAETGPAFIDGSFLKTKFLPTKPYDSWIIDEESVTWVAPIPFPVLQEGEFCQWDEENQVWNIKKLDNQIN